MSDNEQYDYILRDLTHQINEVRCGIMSLKRLMDFRQKSWPYHATEAVECIQLAIEKLNGARMELDAIEKFNEIWAAEGRVQ